MEDKVISKLKKLKALADTGLGGEKENAKEMLYRLLEKHDLTESTLEDSTIECHWYNYTSGLERRIMVQVFANVVGWNRATQTWLVKGRNKRGIDVTKAEAIEIEVKYTLYCKQLRQELEFLCTAFIDKNNIYDVDAPGGRRLFSDADIEKMSQIREAVDHVKTHNKVEDH
tara:strand:- start:8259 stop:8771 length:513 start_codon:yes stop_codon:yes gene_type:complete